MFVALALTQLVVGCGAASDEARATEAGVESSPEAPPPSRDRTTRDVCGFTKHEARELGSVAEGFDSLDRLPASILITWVSAAEPWLGREELSGQQTEVTIELVEASVTNIVSLTPAPGAPSLCEARVEFDADLRVRTNDTIIDAPGHAQFVARRSKTEARIRIDHEITSPAAAQTTRSLGAALELPGAAGEAVKFELLGHELRTGTGPTGRVVLAGGEEVLASSAEPLAQDPRAPRGSPSTTG